MSRTTGLAAAMAVAVVTAATAQAQDAPSNDVTTDSGVYLSAQTLTDDQEARQLVAEGNVEARYQGRILRADRLIYDLENERIRAQGNVQIIDSDGSIRYADEIEVDENLDDGFATRFYTRLPNDAIATASSAVRQNGSLNALEQASYTACPVCEESEERPTWALRARRAVQDQEKQMIAYQDAVLEIKGVPVFYIPYMSHPDPSSDRRSGLLPPDIGVSSKLGVFYEQPYYWAMSPSQDLTISPLLTTKVNPVLGVDYRKRFYSGIINLEGSFTHEQDFDSDGDKFGDDTWRSHIYGSGIFQINTMWRWGFGVERQSDDLYDRRYDIDGANEARGPFVSQPRQLLSQLYAIGQNRDFYFEGGLLSFQGLREEDDPGEIPLVTPTLYSEKILDFGDFGSLSIAGSSAVFTRDTGNDSGRVTGDVNWRARSIVGPGLVVEPFAQARLDYYLLDTVANGEENETRSLGLVGAEVSWPFIRPGKNVDLTIEPIVMAATGTSGANDDGIPNEDSLLFESDDSTLFRANGVGGYDVWEGGSRISAGVQASARWRNGFEVNGLVGRRWREESDDAFNLASNLSGTTSDYVANVGVRLNRTLNLSSRMRFSEGNLDLSRLDLRASTDVWRLRAAARYYKLNDRATIGSPEEGVELRGSLRVTDNWSAVYSQQRNIEENTNIRQTVGVAYEDECTYFQVAFERSEALDRTLGPSDSVTFTFALKTLGQVGSSDAD